MERETYFAELALTGRAPRDQWPLAEEPARFGLRTQGLHLVPAGRHDPLMPEQIRAALSRQTGEWLQRLDVFPITDSTSAELMRRARTAGVDGQVCLAELQIQGRGRRGRSWFSPFGANLAMSFGKRMRRPASALGGLSLVVGLGVLDALERLGVGGLALKWPNDVLLDGRKLGGILIELASSRDTELVVGIGLNVALPEQVRAALPEPVADLSHLAVPPSRNELAGRILSGVLELVAGFEDQGFAPFRAAFEQRHLYQGRECLVHQSNRQIAGVVAGVSGEGELILDAADGRQVFHGGEVSLRRMV